MYSDIRDRLLGSKHARVRIAGVAIALPVLSSIAFLLEFDVVLGFAMLYLSIAATVFAGFRRAGLLAGLAPVFLVILWRFIFPPFVGYLRWSMDTRYTPPRMLGYKLYPDGELIEGLTHGPVYAVIGAILLGGIAYSAGSLFRRLYQQGKADR